MESHASKPDDWTVSRNSQANVALIQGCWCHGGPLTVRWLAKPRCARLPKSPTFPFFSTSLGLTCWGVQRGSLDGQGHTRRKVQYWIRCQIPDACKHSSLLVMLSPRVDADGGVREESSVLEASLSCGKYHCHREAGHSGTGLAPISSFQRLRATSASASNLSVGQFSRLPRTSPSPGGLIITPPPEPRPTVRHSSANTTSTVGGDAAASTDPTITSTAATYATLRQHVQSWSGHHGLEPTHHCLSCRLLLREGQLHDAAV